MPTRQLDFPVFDADNHMYETREALTRHLPAAYEGIIKYVEVNGRTKIAVNGIISDYIPNPTFDRVAAPGAQEEYYKVGNKEGKSRREIMGRGIDALPATAPAPSGPRRQRSERAPPAPGAIAPGPVACSAGTGRRTCPSREEPP